MKSLLLLAALVLVSLTFELPKGQEKEFLAAMSARPGGSHGPMIIPDNSNGGG